MPYFYGMKWLITIWAVCVVLLSALPCPDGDCCAYTGSAPASHHTDAPASDADDHHAPCSPFCHCATCLGFTLTPAIIYLQPPSSLYLSRQPVRFAYAALRPDDVLLTIWQPPKV
ncbi:hypothetical protein [Spirosoma montaniterrae]|uniref:DUF2946 domain-containing protein n=1 Tax=Spirosoma montaniterrae TaxID=1178516 RepID=A0A1P9WWQ5_9BACT|nr:hypothetical protein [Spirosoma montaniterrae]AQG79815.1 hypothetical protein AWR27_11060 [Spirosoma montaniterrae]